MSIFYVFYTYIIWFYIKKDISMIFIQNATFLVNYFILALQSNFRGNIWRTCNYKNPKNPGLIFREKHNYVTHEINNNQVPWVVKSISFNCQLIDSLIRNQVAIVPSFVFQKMTTKIFTLPSRPYFPCPQYFPLYTIFSR